MTLRQTINKIKKLFKGNDCFLKVNFHYLSGFIKIEDKWIYVSSNDERFNPKYEENLLFRTAKDNKDFTGGRNNFFNINIVKKEQILNLLKEVF